MVRNGNPYQSCQIQILEIRSFRKESGVDQEIFSRKSGEKSGAFFQRIRKPSGDILKKSGGISEGF
jgi:hypothetical protein